MVSLKPIAYGKLFHLLRIITTIEGKQLSFKSPYDYHTNNNRQISSDDIGEWTLIGGDTPATYWKSKDTNIHKPVQTSTNWLGFGIDELLSYPVNTFTRAIRQWKIQYKKNQIWRRKYSETIPADIQKSIKLSQTLHSLECRTREMEKQLLWGQKNEPTQGQIEQIPQRLQNLWQKTGKLFCDNKKYIPIFDTYTGSESLSSPIITCLVMPHSSLSSSPLCPQTVDTSGLSLAQSNSYFMVQNTLLRHIRLATYFREWLSSIPAPARRFANKQDHTGFRWFLINLWIHAPKSRSLLENDSELTYLIASTWNHPSSIGNRNFARLDQLIPGKRKLLLTELGLPPTRSMLRMIRQDRITPKQRIIRHKQGGVSYAISIFDKMQTNLIKLLPVWPWAWSWIAPYGINKAYRGSLLLVEFLNTSPDRLKPPTIHLFQHLLEDSPQKPSPYAQCFTCLDLLKSVITQADPELKQKGVYLFKQLTRCKSTNKVQTILQKAHSLWDEARMNLLFNKPTWKARLSTFPKSSPLEEIPSSWTPLVSLDQIRKEGREMEHCLYREHLREIADNCMFAYSIYGPKNERATLTIRKPIKLWKFDQLVGCNNTEPSLDLSLTVLKVLPDLLRKHEKNHHPRSLAEQQKIDQHHNDHLIINALTTFKSKLDSA